MFAEREPVDETVLSFVAAHELVLFDQARLVAGEEAAAAAARLDRLIGDGLLALAPRLRFQPAAYRITQAGLDRLGSDLPTPTLDARRYWHQLGLAWLWVTAQCGGFGPVDAVYSRRAMRAADAAASAPSRTELVSPELRAKLADARFAIESGDGRWRYPGLVLVVPQGRIALEWLLTEPSGQWVDAVLRGYAAKPHVRVAVLIAQTIALRDTLATQIARHGLEDRVQAQHGRFTYGATRPTEGVRRA